ncbi:MAG: HIT domain-containing protein [Phycisphaerales bacterium]|nr:HIT domain-containing protein [Phycisphaerales bacterium]
MGECSKNLWASWRSEYIHSLGEPADGQAGGCFLCRYAGQPEQDALHHVLWRGLRCLTMFNRFPYNNGHLLVAPLDHLAGLDELDEPTLDELIRTVRDAQRLLGHTTNAHGFNVGMNFGRCAGAGLPGHLHVHIVPRWEGDTNFMAVISDNRVISESIESLYNKMRAAAEGLGLPALRG